MDDLHQEMAQVKHNALVDVQAQEQKAANQEHISDDIQKQLSSILSDMAHEFVSGDKELELEHLDDEGFTIVYGSDGTNMAAPFVVTSSTKSNIGTLEVKDGEWREAPNVSGAWGSWTNEKTIFQGAVDNEKIRSVLTTAFLKWYNTAIKLS